MKYSEPVNILVAIIVLTAAFGFSFALNSQWDYLPSVFFFSVIIIMVAVFSKKLIAYMLDSDVEHEVWQVYRYGWHPGWHFEKPVAAGIILPIFLTLFSWGFLKFTALLTYESRALKTRAARRFGYYSVAEMTEWHNSVIGASGIVSVLIIAIVAYFLPANLEYLAKMATFYVFWNMIPVSNLDGAQIFFGSRILYSILAIITLIFTLYALVIL